MPNLPENNDGERRARVTGRDEPKKSVRPGFRRRVNPYYDGMTRKQIAADTAKTTLRWASVTAFLFAYWLVMLLLLSLILVNVWEVTFIQLLIYAAVLCVVSSLIYAGVLIHRKFYY